MARPANHRRAGPAGCATTFDLGIPVFGDVIILATFAAAPMRAGRTGWLAALPTLDMVIDALGTSV